MLEYYWGEHIHLGWYAEGQRKGPFYGGKDFIEAKYDFIDRMLDFSKTNAPKKVLDVGCGIGGTSRYIAKKFPQAEVTGITISPEQQRRATQLAAERGVANAKFELCPTYPRLLVVPRSISEAGSSKPFSKPNSGNRDFTVSTQVWGLRRPAKSASSSPSTSTSSPSRFSPCTCAATRSLSCMPARLVLALTLASSICVHVSRTDGEAAAAAVLRITR